jgi:glycosyltransferase involved in cell wall biosynthesis
MRVGVFLSNTLPETGGGATFESTIVYSLLELAADLPHTFVIFGRHQPFLQALCQQHQNVEFYSLRTLLFETLQRKPHQVLLTGCSRLRRKKSSFQLTEAEEKMLVDSLHQHGIEMMWYPTPVRLTTEIPYIVAIWDLQHRLQPYFPEVSTLGQWDERERYYQKVLKRATFVLTGTEVGKDEIELFYQSPQERIQVIPLPTPNFVLSTEIQPEQSILEKYQLSENYLFYPAQFWSHKNHFNLLLALQILKNQYHLSLQLVLVGSDKGNRSFIQQQVETLGLSDQVKFLGFIPQADLVSLYQNALALTFVSFFGPDNLPPLEAFALGCPVIAADVAGAAEQLGDAALRVDPQQPEQIALAVKQICEDETLRATLIQRGYDRAMKWTGKDYVKRVAGLLSQFESIRRCWSL